MRNLALLAVLALAACQPAPTPSTQTPIVAQAPGPVSGIAALINQQRAANGRGPITENARLSRAARDHAQDMVTNNYFSHQGLNGSNLSSRARAAGYNCVAAENIAWGQRSEAEVMNEWMNSAGHRRNILLSDAREFGIGRVNNHWVMLLGRGC
ncbi:Uncharacterized conserved protein YkwD, contains CAP (CSP/antigen 5/PR1) domain [Octadecabacter temperatus]|uniref:Cysteine-rich secretory protein family protein n=1 Tax=Octadecabacter temperatus TaxID=1458307 RepID=A0A0K0Y3K5_9RHOB|nr:CAP domain-containing protein [Octadecabacter temperatus]AKS45462.1 Cysteine-rich secretory protein family protein [Octadecabacter temperatus]SIN93459.1 Uncharacterized conserved protein YkwD, contains CAP (CSP/antigen 5/PR1) domain [Octadecabacter temperatus]